MRQESDFPCSFCGVQKHEIGYMESCVKELRKHQLCFTCNHWREVSESLNVYVVKGKAWTDAGDIPNAPAIGKQFMGSGGTRTRIRKFDGTVVETNNLWCRGIVPEAWKDKLPDNAEFLPFQSRLKS